MITKLWSVVKFIAKYWWIFEPVGRFAVNQGKKLYEKVFKKIPKPKNLGNKS